MGRELDAATLAKIRFMFSLGLSCRDIARYTPACKSAVFKVIKRPFGKPQRKAALARLEPRRVPAYQCECGFTVTWRPCVVCAARAKAST